MYRRRGGVQLDVLSISRGSYRIRSFPQLVRMSVVNVFLSDLTLYSKFCISMFRNAEILIIRWSGENIHKTKSKKCWFPRLPGIVWRNIVTCKILFVYNSGQPKMVKKHFLWEKLWQLLWNVILTICKRFFVQSKTVGN